MQEESDSSPSICFILLTGTAGPWSSTLCKSHVRGRFYKAAKCVKICKGLISSDTRAEEWKSCEGSWVCAPGAPHTCPEEQDSRGRAGRVAHGAGHQLGKPGREGREKSSVSSRAEQRGVLRHTQPVPALLSVPWVLPPPENTSPCNFIQPHFVQTTVPFLAQLGGTINKNPSKVRQAAGK